MLLFSANPASAEISEHRDARGDLPSARADRQLIRAADIVQIRSSHEGRTFTVTLTLTDLTRATTYAALRLRTADKSEYRIELDRMRGGKTISFDAPPSAKRDPRECRGLTGRFFSESDRIVITVPRRCLTASGRVRSGALVASSSPDYAEIRGDDARRRGGRVLGMPPSLDAAGLSHN